MFADLLFRKAITDKLGGLSPAEQNQLVNLIEKNPDLFMKLAQDFKEKIAAGKSQNDAALEVLKNHEGQLRSLGY